MSVLGHVRDRDCVRVQDADVVRVTRSQIDKIFSGTQHPAFLCQDFIKRNIGGVILPVVATEVPDKLLSILAHASLEDPTF